VRQVNLTAANHIFVREGESLGGEVDVYEIVDTFNSLKAYGLLYCDNLLLLITHVSHDEPRLSKVDFNMLVFILSVHGELEMRVRVSLMQLALQL
jgi:hypothetical protein